MLEIRTAGGVDDWRLLRWTDAGGDPLPLEPPSAGVSACLPPSPFGVAYPVALRGIGRVYLWADGFTARTPTILVERELAQRYLKAANALVRQYARRGAPLEEVQNCLQQAQSLASSQQWLECLAESVSATERGVVSVARTRIQRMRGRTAFLWGVRAGCANTAHAALERLGHPLNLIHLDFKSPSTDWNAVIQRAQSGRMAIAASITNSNPPHPLTDDLRNLISHYRGQVRYWTLASCDNGLDVPGASPSPLVELCEAARAIDFGVVRLLRGVHSFHGQLSAYPALERCVEMSVPFEAVHFEWRWYDGTLYDLDQLLERYGELGKPIHLELSLPPEGGYEVFTRDEPSQWLEAACLVALSKPYVVTLRLPLTASASSAGLATEKGQPSAFWETVREIAVWNQGIQER